MLRGSEAGSSPGGLCTASCSGLLPNVRSVHVSWLPSLSSGHMQKCERGKHPAHSRISVYTDLTAFSSLSAEDLASQEGEEIAAP